MKEGNKQNKKKRMRDLKLSKKKKRKEKIALANNGVQKKEQSRL